MVPSCAAAARDEHDEVVEEWDDHDELSPKPPVWSSSSDNAFNDADSGQVSAAVDATTPHQEQCHDVSTEQDSARRVRGKISNECILATAFVSFMSFALVQICFAIIAKSKAMKGDSAAMVVDGLSYLFNWLAEYRKNHFVWDYAKTPLGKSGLLPLDQLDAAQRAYLKTRACRKIELQMEVVTPLIAGLTLVAVTVVLSFKAIQVLLSPIPPVQGDEPNVVLMMIFSLINLGLDAVNVGCFACAKHLLGYSTKGAHSHHNNHNHGRPTPATMSRAASCFHHGVFATTLGPLNNDDDDGDDCCHSRLSKPCPNQHDAELEVEQDDLERGRGSEAVPPPCVSTSRDCQHDELEAENAMSLMQKMQRSRGTQEALSPRVASCEDLNGAQRKAESECTAVSLVQPSPCGSSSCQDCNYDERERNQPQPPCVASCECAESPRADSERNPASQVQPVPCSSSGQDCKYDELEAENKGSLGFQTQSPSCGSSCLDCKHDDDDDDKDSAHTEAENDQCYQASRSKPPPACDASCDDCQVDNHMMEEDRANLNMCSAYTHVFADTLRSLAVIVAATLAEFVDGISADKADSSAALAVSILILMSVVPLFQGLLLSVAELKDIYTEERRELQLAASRVLRR